MGAARALGAAVCVAAVVLAIFSQTASAGHRINEAIDKNNYWGMIGVKKWHQLGAPHTNTRAPPVRPPRRAGRR